MSEGKMRAIHAIIKGRVQGVFFRAYTRQTAEQLGITGWVRNKPDGTVECFAQGPEDALTEFIGFLHQGSPSSWVESVELHDVNVDADHRIFKISY